ncbi:MAG: selenocysteine-specific translation elongation factor, partial [Oscillospiraceae bacterium]|nr:selenocysteine-specific translation elongation factor [Oscillospiraceae bacterium]
VDHGKTALVRRITGVNTDRLKEEQERGITIELGFAPFELPNGQRLGIVDVPGHERFIKNMLAGATGIDIVLFVIAADEGIMPQTREHMNILRLLGVGRGVVAITKIDLVDTEWLELVREDVEEFIKDSPLSGAEIVELSSVTGEGIPELLGAVERLCDTLPERPSGGICRLAVDRVFTMSGFGTVVTGTLWSGGIRQGDTLELLPAGKQVRVRSLQVHGEKRDEVFQGERVAVNLTGVEKNLVVRGSWLAEEGKLVNSLRMDIRLELLPEAPETAQRTRVHVHHGTAEALARVVLLDRDVLQPGESCFAQLELETPLAALAGDRVVLRFYSPMFTIGGGTVLDPTASKHRKRNLESDLARLSALSGGDPAEILTASMIKDGLPWQLRDAAECLRTDEKEAAALTEKLRESGRLTDIGDGYYIPTVSAEALKEKAAAWLADYFARFPMRFGAPKKEIAQTLFPRADTRQQRALLRYLADAGNTEQDDTMIRPAGWTPKLTPAQSALTERIREAYAASPFAPPGWNDVMAEVGISDREQGEYQQWFLRSGEMVRLSENVIYTREALDSVEKTLREHYPAGGFSLAEVRDLLGTPRRYVQQMIEYFDLIKLTYWDGEKHFWNSEAERGRGGTE